MVCCLKDVADITLPPGSCKFDYLVAVGNRERLLLEKGRYIDEDEHYFLTGVDLDENPQDSIKIPSKIDDEKKGFTVVDARKQGSKGKMPKIVFLGKDEWKKKLMGSFHGCLSGNWKRSVAKSVVQDSTKMPISVSNGIDFLGKDDWEKKLMGSFHGCLSWKMSVVDSKKMPVSISTQCKTPDSVISNSCDGGRASSNKIKKRLRYEEDEIGGEAMAERKINSKKAKRESSSVRVQEPPPGLPVEYRNLIRVLAGDREVCVEKLVIQKELTATDVDGSQCRMSIPARLVREAFLTEAEELHLCQRNGRNVNTIDVPLITPIMGVTIVSLRRWEMRKPKGVPSVSYVIAGSWNEVTTDNNLRSKTIIQLWAIRVIGKLWFALARL